jgi:L-asparaginase
VSAPAGFEVQAEQVCQIDSKDLGPAHWQRLVAALVSQLERADVAAVVVTHGTDTMEETAYLLQRVLAPDKPVVLTGAMHPASAETADGPRNLADALVVASDAAARGQGGVVVVVAGLVLSGTEVRKLHSRRLDAFGAGDAGPLAHIEAGRVQRLREWPRTVALGARVVATPVALWPQVEIVVSHAGANGRIVKLLMTAGIDGLVVAATGNGTLHSELESALVKAERSGVKVLRSTRCAAGGVTDPQDDGAPQLPAGAVASASPRRLPSAGQLTPVQARVELLLNLLAARQRK